MFLTKIWRAPNSLVRQVVRFYSYDPNNFHRSHQKFSPSLGKSGQSSVESRSEKIEPVDVEEMLKTKSVRHLYFWDKWILVKMGKFKSIKDVPDEIKINTKVDESIKKKVRAELLETTFKYVYGLDYLLWMLCFSFCIPVFYWYYNKQKGLPERIGTPSNIGIALPSSDQTE